MRILVTGHCGFIGAHFVKHALANDRTCEVIGFGRISDSNNHKRLNIVPFMHRDRLQTVWGDLCDVNAISGLCEGIDVVVNFAAKTFVDHSLKDRKPFIDSNIIGADNLMEDATRYGVKRFIQVSTDEVYGQILTGAYREDAMLQPRNPYSWSKACADLNAIQRHRTYGFPVIITRTENNFGPWQHRQKVLPTFVREALIDRPIPVYGDGLHVRCWLHVEEHCRAIWHLIHSSLGNGETIAKAQQTNHNFDEIEQLTGGGLSRTAPCNAGYLGEVFHIAGEQELTNIALAKLVLRTLNKPETQIKYISDHDIRPGHDRRYALDCAKLKATGFEITQDLEVRLIETILWYAEHSEWTK